MKPVKKTRDVTREYELATDASIRNVLDTEVIDLPALKRAAYAHGYAQALMDVSDGAVFPPKPVWKHS